MKALSIKQPWLWAITDLDKKIENRTWKPPKWIIGQTIALHASKTLDGSGILAIKKISGVLPPQKRLPCGAILATARIAGFEDANDFNPFEDDFDKWFFGPYGWVLENVQKLTKPIPCSGALGLWDVPVEFLPTLQPRPSNKALHWNG